MEADGEEQLSEFERKLRSRMNTLKPSNTAQNSTQTLDRRRPTASAVRTGPRTTDDVGSARPPPSGGGLSLQEELKRRAASRRNGPSAGGGNPSGSSGVNGGFADRGRQEAPLPALMPTGKKKVPVPPTLKSGPGEPEEQPPGRPSWESKKNKISDMANKWNSNQAGPDQNQDSVNRNGFTGSRKPAPSPPIPPAAAKPPKPKPTVKDDPSNNILQKFNSRPQNNDFQGSRSGGVAAAFHERKESFQHQNNAPPPPFGRPPDVGTSPALPSKGPPNNFNRRQNTMPSVNAQPEEGEAEAEAPPPAIPKRMESFKKEKPVPSAPRNEPSWNSGESGAGAQNKVSNRVKKKASLGRMGESTPRMSGDRSGCITPVGSSSESDYSGDGHVRRNRQIEARNPKIGSSPAKQGTVKAKPPAMPDSFRKGTITKPPIRTSSGPMADLNATFPNSVKLSEFIEDHKHLLPIKVQVLNEIASEGNVHLSKNETLFFHLLKKTEIVVLNGETDLYNIPWCSKVKFGLIYNPIETDENVSSYMKLPTAGDIMKLKQLPLIVTAMTRSDCGSPKKSVNDKEILFVKGIVQGAGMGRGRQELHVINTDNEEKFLGSQCAGNFTTDPHHMKVHLSTLMSNGIELPQYVIIYPDRELRGLLPQNLSNCPVLLASKTEELSVVASRGDMKSESSHTEQMLELIEDLDVNIKPVRISVSEKNFLKQVTTTINENFNASNSISLIQSVRNTSAPLQEYFYNGLLEEATGGISLEIPETSDTAQGESEASGGRTSLDETSHFDHRRSAQEDAISIGSHTSGNPSSMALNAAADSSTYEAEEEEDQDPDDFYEDISELQEDYQAEKKKLEESTKSKPVEKKMSSPATPSTPSNTKGFSKFFKKKKGKKNEKEKAYELSPEPSSVPASPATLPPSAKQNSDSESYDEVQPAEDCYMSDNYEDCSFNEAASNGPPPVPNTLPPIFTTPPGGGSSTSAPPLPSTAPPLPSTLPPSTQNFDQKKKKLMQRPPVVLEKAVKPDTPLISPTTSDLSQDGGEYADADVVSLPDHVMAMKNQMKERQGGPVLPPQQPSFEPPSLPPPLSIPTKAISGGELSLSSLNTQVVQLNGEVESLKEEVKRLAGILEKLGFSGGKKSTPEDNLKILKAMSVDGICAMLDAMDLQKYKAAFAREGINGLLFSDLDEATLKEDLKVASKLHRNRLLSIINGKNPPPR